MEITDCAIQKIFSEFICPIEVVFQMLGGKWRSRILWEIGKFGKPIRYGEIHKKLDGISDKTLAHQLHELESMEIIIRREFYEFPPKVEYCLSDFGKTLKPIFNATAAWISENESEVRRIFFDNPKKTEVLKVNFTKSLNHLNSKIAKDAP